MRLPISKHLLKKVGNKKDISKFYNNLLNQLEKINICYQQENDEQYLIILRTLCDDIIDIFDIIDKDLSNIVRTPLWGQISSLDKSNIFATINKNISIIREINDSRDASNSLAHYSIQKSQLDYKDLIPSSLAINFLIQILILGHEQKEINNKNNTNKKEVVDYEILFNLPRYEDLLPMQSRKDKERAINYNDTREKEDYINLHYVNLLLGFKHNFKIDKDSSSVLNITNLVLQNKWVEILNLLKKYEKSINKKNNPKKYYQLLRLKLWALDLIDRKSEALELAQKIWQETASDNNTYLQIRHGVSIYLFNNYNSDFFIANKDQIYKFQTVYKEKFPNLEFGRDRVYKSNEFVESLFKNTMNDESSIFINGYYLIPPEWLKVFMCYISEGNLFYLSGLLKNIIYLIGLRYHQLNTSNIDFLKLLTLLFYTDGHDCSDLMYISLYLRSYDLQNYLLDMQPIINYLINKKINFSNNEIKFIISISDLLSPVELNKLLVKIINFIKNYSNETRYNSISILDEYINLYKHLILSNKSLYNQEKNSFMSMLLSDNIKNYNYYKDVSIGKYLYHIYNIWEKYAEVDESILEKYILIAENILKNKQDFCLLISAIYSICEKSCPMKLVSIINQHYPLTYSYLNKACLPPPNTDIVNANYTILQKSIDTPNNKNSSPINFWNFICFIDLANSITYKTEESINLFFNYAKNLELKNPDYNGSYEHILLFQIGLISLFDDQNISIRKILMSNKNFSKMIEKYIYDTYWHDTLSNNTPYYNSLKEGDELKTFKFLSSILYLLIEDNKSIKSLHSICNTDLPLSHAYCINSLNTLYSYLSENFQEFLKLDFIHKIKSSKTDIAIEYAKLYNKLFKDGDSLAKCNQFIAYPVYYELTK